MEEGKEVKRWEEETERLRKEIAHVTQVLKGLLKIGVSCQQLEKKKGLEVEKRLVERRVREFRCAMECLLKVLEEEEENEEEKGNEDCDDDVNVLRFDRRLDWKRLHCLIMRERRRLEEGLPIYAYRRDILRAIHFQQVSYSRNFRRKKKKKKQFFLIFEKKRKAIFYVFIRLWLRSCLRILLKTIAGECG